MARPRKHRIVAREPDVTYFKPTGIPLRELEENKLSVEELEALRLKDIEGLDQEACAKKMHISRPTFQRVLATARKKTADAIVSGKALRIGGGDYMVGRGKMGGTGLGPGGECVCPKCGYKSTHAVGSPCMHQKCPKCGATMSRA